MLANSLAPLDPDCSWLNEPPPCLPEERLRLAVFQRAILDVLPTRSAVLGTGKPRGPDGTRYLRVDPMNRKSALKYLLEDVDQDWIYSLSAVADQLGFTVDAIRSMVKKLMERAEGGDDIDLLRYSRWTRVGDGKHKKHGAGRPKRDVRRWRAG